MGHSDLDPAIHERSLWLAGAENQIPQIFDQLHTHPQSADVRAQEPTDIVDLIIVTPLRKARELGPEVFQP